MKSHFYEYYSNQGDCFDLWPTCLFVFDTNVILNFYRYSKDTLDQLYSSVENYSNRIWLPYNVGLEFFENRVAVIDEQVNNYQEKAKVINDLLKSFKTLKGHPFISKELLQELESVTTKITREFNSNRRELSSLIFSDDSILQKVTELFEGKVGAAYSNEILSSLYQEAKIRFDNFTPPGYMDNRKSGNRKYGDFIIWKQMLDKAASDKLPVVFISDDEKEDWVLKVNNVVMGPSPALIKEFKETTGYSYHSCTTTDFLKNTAKDKKEQVNDTVIQEIQSVNSIIVENRPKNSINNFYKIEFIINVNSSGSIAIKQFEETIGNRGYYLQMIERNGNALLYNLVVPFEDLERRFRKVLEELVESFRFQLLTFTSHSLNYTRAD